jgi:hypothetical protein
VDLHDYRLPGGLHSYVPIGQVNSFIIQFTNFAFIYIF